MYCTSYKDGPYQCSRLLIVPPPCFVLYVHICGWAGVSTLQAQSILLLSTFTSLTLLLYSTLLLIILCTSSSPTRGEKTWLSTGLRGVVFPLSSWRCSQHLDRFLI
jgi:hypothetical protein